MAWEKELQDIVGLGHALPMTLAADTLFTIAPSAILTVDSTMKEESGGKNS